MRRLLQGLAAVLSGAGILAASNFDPDYTLAQSEYLGLIDWRPAADSGASINQFYCSGFLHADQAGWISLGSGAAPLDGLRYRNDFATDFGVNVLPSGGLRGFAYGANIGWISFEEKGNPRVDWTTGQVKGSVYSANAGWISLESAGGLKITHIPESPDLDRDGLPDAWEVARASTITLLKGTADSDGDGVSDRDEFLAGTDPLDKNDRLGPIALSLDAASNALSIRWPSKAGHIYVVEFRPSLASGAWAPLNSAGIAGTGNLVSLSVPGSHPSVGFFRVRAFPPLTSFN